MGKVPKIGAPKISGLAFGSDGLALGDGWASSDGWERADAFAESAAGLPLAPLVQNSFSSAWHGNSPFFGSWLSRD